MAHDFDDDSTDNDTGDELNDLESFLRDKDKQWTKPATELTPTEPAAIPNLDEHFEIKDADAAGENSSPETKSSETTESTPASESTSAPDVESASTEDADEDVPEADSIERTTELKLHKHPIINYHVSEESVAFKQDEEWQRMYRNARQVSVTKLSPEEIIERSSKLNRAIKLIRAQQLGYRSGLAEKVGKLNDADKARIHKLDSEAHLKTQTRTRIERIRKKAGAETVAKPKKAKKSPIAIRIDTLKNNLGMTKEAVIKHLQEAKLLDAVVLDYINKLVW